jgi:hypothetical protein
MKYFSNLSISYRIGSLSKARAFGLRATKLGFVHFKGKKGLIL